MPDPSSYLPPPFPDSQIQTLIHSISLPPPRTINRLKVTAAFHVIYVLTYDWDIIQPYLPTAETSSSDETSTFDLILRVSGDHLAQIKTENEACVISWVSKNTSIPVPSIIRYDATTTNSLGREYIIFPRSPGVAVSDIYDTLSQSRLDHLLNQLIDILLELHSHPFTQIGGLKHNPNYFHEIVSGPILDETFWFTPDIPLYFPSTPTETTTTLNISGPFPNYTSYITASIRSYIHVINIHPSLSSLRPRLLPRLESFISLLNTPSSPLVSTLNDVPIRLAHKDLHFANILISPQTCLITSILDWEFAGTVPYPRWDPSRAFLWNGQDTPEANTEKYRLRDRWMEICEERGGNVKKMLIDNAEYTSVLQEKMQTVVNYLRAIVTTVPKGECHDKMEEWVGEMERALEAFETDEIRGSV